MLPLAKPFETYLNVKVRVPVGALPKEQLGHSVKSGYVSTPVPVLSITSLVVLLSAPDERGRLGYRAAGYLRENHCDDSQSHWGGLALSCPTVIQNGLTL